MTAESLIGTTLGTCTLQQFIGQGSMAAVFLAQQAQPSRQVAVKVLMPAISLKPTQQAAYLERFRRETNITSLLEHPNIIPVYEHGEKNGLPYLVMPYISGGTLHDELKQKGALPFFKVVDYFEQLAAALDFAHQREVIHRDVKPANILKTSEGRLVLTDFGLVKIVTRGQSAKTRLTNAGTPMGTPDYMAPEQVMGGDRVDGRADLYSLGVILYQMVTGRTPFQGETPAQVVVQHLQLPPLSPRSLRPDLPVAAEQVMLRALAKSPESRYARAQDLAVSFRVALTAANIQLENSSSTTGSQTSIKGFKPRGLFDPRWQTGQVSSSTTGMLPPVGETGAEPAVGKGQGDSKPSGILPPVEASPIRPGGSLSDYKTGKLPPVEASEPPVPMSPVANKSAVGGEGTTGVHSTMSAIDPLSPLPATTTTGALQVPGNGPQTAATGAVRPTGVMKVVQVPVAGQPGRYVTGLLPVLPDTPRPADQAKGSAKKRLQMIVSVAILLLLLLSAGGFWFASTHLGQDQLTKPQKGTPSAVTSTPDRQATAAAQTTATASANIILVDPLSENINNWPISTSGPKIYVFKDRAYHITNNDNTQSATAILPDRVFSKPISYSLTMEEIQGNDNSLNNSFGMILRFSTQTSGGKTITRFYLFEVENMKGGEYQFWMFDNSKGNSLSPWTELLHKQFGSEFHQGHGAKSVNAIKIVANGKNFTFTVNGKKVATTSDSSITGGQVGMLVNLKGTEVAFSDLELTYV